MLRPGRRAGGQLVQRRLLLTVSTQRGDDWRERLIDARVMLIFTPEVCGVPSTATGTDRGPALERLEAALEAVDIVQVRPKTIGADGLAASIGAREAFEWTSAALDLANNVDEAPVVMVDDRVDVAAALLDQGCAGVHIGADDCPATVARSFLGAEALIGLSTHSTADVVRALDEPVDYLGFGPIHPTGTKGYERGLGPEAAWVAKTGSALPLFAIGGIDSTNVAELGHIGRVAVSSAILGCDDPGRAARELQDLLAVDPFE